MTVSYQLATAVTSASTFLISDFQFSYVWGCTYCQLFPPVGKTNMLIKYFVGRKRMSSVILLCQI